MNTLDAFTVAGFLSLNPQTKSEIQAENDEWFSLARDVNTTLMRIIMHAVYAEAAHGGNWSKEAVALRILMRATSSFQGVILLTSHGMATQARMMIRTIVEDSFFAAALLEEPDHVIQLLRNDSEARRRSQAKFIVEQQLGDDPAALKMLEKAIAEMDRRARALNCKEMASLSSMLPQYLTYQRLSDDALHTSATSISKHMAINDAKSGWSYRIGPEARDDLTATLHRAVLAVLPLGIVVTNIVGDSENNSALRDLAEQWKSLPAGPVV